MCEQNSTEIPTAITRLTNETELSEMFHQNMSPIKFTTIQIIVIIIIKAEVKSKPSKTKSTKKVVISEKVRLSRVFKPVVRYCS